MAVLDEAATATDLRQTLAALQRELDQRTVERNEALAQQAATSEILGVISRSPTDTQPVFEAIVVRAAALCEAEFSAVATLEDGLLHLVAVHSMSPEETAAFHSLFPRPPTRNFTMGRAFVDARPVHFADVLTEFDYDTRTIEVLQSVAKYRSFLGVPIFREGKPIGVIGCGRREVRPFAAAQIDLVKIFADQAAIAIENVRLFGELETRNRDVNEALEQQTATAEVLQVINSSPGDLTPVFKEMLEKATRLCDAPSGIFWTFDGEFSRAAALHGIPDAFGEYLREPIRLDPVTGLGRVRQGEQVAVSVDLAAEEPYRAGNPQRRAFVDLGQARSAVRVPLVKDSRLLGIFTVYRQEVRPFTDKQIALLQNFTAQAVIAMENARLINETREALEQQTATSEVLQVINSSPGDLTPVFDAILEKAHSLCDIAQGSLELYDGEWFRAVAVRGLSDEFAEILRQGCPAADNPATQPLIEGRRFAHILDLAETDYTVTRSAAELDAARTLLCVPLRRDGALLGMIASARREVRAFSDKEIALLENFAAQAVIAMENARLITETREALEQQTATAEVLGVINSSPGDLAPVFQSMVERAVRLCEADEAALRTFDGQVLHLVAAHGEPGVFEQLSLLGSSSLGPTSLYHPLVRGERVLHMPDVRETPAYTDNPAARRRLELRGVRTWLAVGLHKDGTLLGVINVHRHVVRPFSLKQIALLQNFAAQAVIAMENARLITETREALDQQTATAEVLQVINASPGELTPVFDAMLEKAMRLCEAAFGILLVRDGGYFQTAALHGVPPALAEFLSSTPREPGKHTAVGRMLDGEDFVHFEDMTKEPAYQSGDPRQRAFVELGGIRTYVAVALRKDGRLVGTIGAYRQELRPFTDKQIALLQNFAAQAVIAMENARLLTETREALEQQTATAEVLQVINSSPGDLAPVLEAMIERAMRLCDAAYGHIYTFDGERIHPAAMRGEPHFVSWMRERGSYPPGPGTPVERTLHGEQVVHIADATQEELYHTSGQFRDLIDLSGIRTGVTVALRRDNTFLGTINVYRREVRPFSNKQIALLQNFANQAVIAMENARLITETRETLEQQTATAEVLQVINASPGDLKPVFDAMLEKALRLCEAAFGLLIVWDGEQFHRVAFRGVPSELMDAMRQPLKPVPGGFADRLVRGERVIAVADLLGAGDQPIGPGAQLLVRFGARSYIGVALRRDEALLGAIVMYRREVRPFSDKQISLLENFAAQAVIAMENARLINETREALQQQTATAEVLQVINRSPGDLAPVFEAILDKAHTLCGATLGSLFLFDGELFRAAAVYGYPEDLAQRLREGVILSATAQLLDDSVRWVHNPDLTQIDAPTARAVSGRGGVRTNLMLPLRKDGKLLGAISCNRQEVRPFRDKEIALLQNFAGQAVIAMENARLLTETREALDQQTATAEVLQVINASPGDLAPVFDAMLEKAMRLCDASMGVFTTFDVNRFKPAISRGVSPRYAEYLATTSDQPSPDGTNQRVLGGENVAHVTDLTEALGYRSGHPWVRALVDFGHARSLVTVALRKDGALLGTITLYRQEVRPFSDKETALLQNFAAQAVIAMENARLLGELHARTDELTRSVAELQALEEVLRAVNSSLDLDTVLATIVSRAAQLSQADEGTIYEFDEAEEVFVPKSAFGMSAERVEALRERRIKLGETHLGRSALLRAPVYVQDVQQDHSVPHAARTLPGIHAVLAVPLLRDEKVVGGLVIRRRTEAGFAPTIPTLLRTFAGQAVLAIENARLFQELGRRGEEARRARTAAEAALADLHRAQDRLIQAEKMASLGQLTAGIAHEIKNPLNFVNNFAGLSVELLEELKETARPAIAGLAADDRADVDEIVAMLTGNLEKIAEHGRRADGIVKSMLEHSRGGSGERREVDLNGLVEEALNLAYHGARAQDQSFNITLERDLDHALAPVELVPQDMTRVLLNLFGNGFYAATKRRRGGAEPDFRPALKVTTRDLGAAVEIRIRDNGTGIPPEIRDKLFQPFFTTKPTGEGTGLGLSISWDIVTQQHGGTIEVDSRVGEFTEFTIHLPRFRQAAIAVSSTRSRAAGN